MWQYDMLVLAVRKSEWHWQYEMASNGGHFKAINNFIHNTLYTVYYTNEMIMNKNVNKRLSCQSFL